MIGTRNLDVEWLDTLLSLVSEFKVTGIFIFFVFFIYTIINMTYQKAKQEYKDTCKAERVDLAIKLEFERKAVIHNTSLIVLIVGFLAIFCSELLLVYGQHKAEKVVREGTLTFTSFSWTDQDNIVKMLSERILYFQDDVGQDVAWIAKSSKSKNGVSELEFMIVVPLHAAENLSKKIIEVGQLEPKASDFAKISIGTTLYNRPMPEKTHNYIDIVRYQTIYLQYSRKGRYGFCVIGNRLTISLECKKDVKVAKT